jgi:hypothetical protein
LIQKRKFLRVLAVIAPSFILLFLFQNCGQPNLDGYQANSDLAGPSGLENTSNPDEVKIVLKNQLPLLSNSKSIDISYDVDIGSNIKISKIECSLDSSRVPCSFSGLSLNQLSDGDHILSIQVTDSNDRVIELLKKNFKIDVTAPLIDITQRSSATTGDGSATIVFSATDLSSGIGSIECSLDSGKFETCKSPLSFKDLATGTHNLILRAKDLAGNLSLETKISWNFDPTLPSVKLDPVNSFSKSKNISFRFSGQAGVSGGTISTYKCQLDEGALTACVTGVAYSNLPEGEHKFSVLAVNSKGVSSAPEVAKWKIDFTPPAIPTVTVVPDKASLSATISFATADKGVLPSGISRYQCSLNFASFSNCSSPMTFSGLNYGNHSVRVVAFDNAENWSTSGDAVWEFAAPPKTEKRKIDGLIESISPTSFGYCAILTDKTLACWGWARNVGTSGFSLEAVGYPLIKNVTKLFTNPVNPSYCAQTAEGKNFCFFGYDDKNYSEVLHDFPIKNFAIESIQENQAVGSQCLVDSRQYVFCWSKMASPSTKKQIILSGVAITADESLVSIRNNIACAVSAGNVKCWLPNANNKEVDTRRPEYVQWFSGSNYKSIKIGDNSVCAITTNQRLDCVYPNNNIVDPKTGWTGMIFQDSPDVPNANLFTFKKIEGVTDYIVGNNDIVHCHLTSTGVFTCLTEESAQNGGTFTYTYRDVIANTSFKNGKLFSVGDNVCLTDSVKGLYCSSWAIKAMRETFSDKDIPELKASGFELYPVRGVPSGFSFYGFTASNMLCGLGNKSIKCIPSGQSCYSNNDINQFSPCVVGGQDKSSLQSVKKDDRVIIYCTEIIDGKTTYAGGNDLIALADYDSTNNQISTHEGVLSLGSTVSLNSKDFGACGAGQVINKTLTPLLTDVSISINFDSTTGAGSLTKNYDIRASWGGGQSNCYGYPTTGMKNPIVKNATCSVYKGRWFSSIGI